jgi:hypothetical protein
MRISGIVVLWDQGQEEIAGREPTLHSVHTVANCNKSFPELSSRNKLNLPTLCNRTTGRRRWLG